MCASRSQAFGASTASGGPDRKAALRVSQVITGASRYVFMSLICVSTYFIYLRDYRKAEDRLAEASRVLDEIADKDSARVAEVRRPLLLRAQAVVFAGLADYARATHRINELREQRSRELLTNRCERARDKCVEAQVLFSAGRLSAVDASKMLAEAGDEIRSLYSDGNPWLCWQRNWPINSGRRAARSICEATSSSFRP